MYFFKTSHLPTPCNLFWASLRLILSYVSVALGRLRAGSPLPSARHPPPVKVAVTSCSVCGGRHPGLREAASGRAAGRRGPRGPARVFRAGRLGSLAGVQDQGRALHGLPSAVGAPYGVVLPLSPGA